MINLFLEAVPVFEKVLEDPNFQKLLEVVGATDLIAIFAGLAILGIIIAIGIYVYMAFAWMTIAKKLGYKKAWLAWIPIANLFLLPILAKKHWTWGFFCLIPPVYLAFAIFWLWNIYERRGYPGELSLITIGHLVPGVSGATLIANLIVFGLVAWKDQNRRAKKK